MPAYLAVAAIECHDRALGLTIICDVNEIIDHDGRFSQGTGERCPTRESGCFQRKLFGSHFVGMLASSLWPAPLGPRKRSQLAAKSARANISKVAMLRKKRISRRGAEAQRRVFNHE